MNKAVIFTFLFMSFGLHAQDFPNFEAELQLLEKNQLKTEELQMRNADAVTGVINDEDLVSDEVATGQAGILKASGTDTDTDETIMMTKKQKERLRRVRSRP